MSCRPDVPDGHPNSEIAVRMDGDLVEVRIPDRCDRAATTALIDLVGAVLCCYPVVSIGLDGLDASTSSVPSRHRDAASSVVREWTHPEVPAEGYVRLRSSTAWWTFDLNRRRLCRSDGPVDVRFVQVADWVGIRRIWASGAGTTALTEHGTFVSTSAGWTTGRRPASSFSSDDLDGGRRPPPRRAA